MGYLSISLNVPPIKRYLLPPEDEDVNCPGYPTFHLDNIEEELSLEDFQKLAPPTEGNFKVEGVWDRVPDYVISTSDVLDLLGIAFHQTAVEHGWLSDETARNPLVLLALITSEVGEMVEAFRKPTQSEHIPEFTAAEEEAADIFIRLAQMCAEHKLRFGAAVVAKSEYNKTRPYKHGGKLY